MSSIGNYSHCWPRFTVEHKKISCSNFVLKAQDWLPSPPANVPRFDLWSNKWLLLRDTPPAPPQLHKSYQIELIVTNYLILQPPRYYSLGTRAWIRACVKGTRHKQDGNLLLIIARITNWIWGFGLDWGAAPYPDFPSLSTGTKNMSQCLLFREMPISAMWASWDTWLLVIL